MKIIAPILLVLALLSLAQIAAPVHAQGEDTPTPTITLTPTETPYPTAQFVGEITYGRMTSVAIVMSICGVLLVGFAIIAVLLAEKRL